MLDYYYKNFQIFGTRTFTLFIEKRCELKVDRQIKIAFEETKIISDETDILVYYDTGKPLLTSCDAPTYSDAR